MKGSRLCYRVDWWKLFQFSCSSYLFMDEKKRQAERVIRPTCKRYNVIATKWNKECYFIIKSDSSNEKSFWNFIENVNKELKFRLDKNTYNKRKIVVYDNAAIHKTKKVKLLVKKI